MIFLLDHIHHNFESHSYLTLNILLTLVLKFLLLQDFFLILLVPDAGRILGQIVADGDDEIGLLQGSAFALLYAGALPGFGPLGTNMSVAQCVGTMQLELKGN